MQKPSDGRRLQRLLTAKEVEELTQIDVKTIYSYVQRGLIPYVRIQSNLRFPEEDLRAWIEDRTCRLAPRPRTEARAAQGSSR